MDIRIYDGILIGAWVIAGGIVVGCSIIAIAIRRAARGNGTKDE